MFIETRKNKSGITYRTSITIDGKKFTSPAFLRKTDCKEWYAKKQNERSTLKLHGHSAKYYQEILINAYAQQWLHSKAASGASPSTMKNYETYVRVHFIPHFNNMDLKDIQKSDVEAFQLKLSKDHNPKGVNVIVGALKGLFREAIKDGYLMKSPAEFVKCLSSDTQHDELWTEAEIDQFLKANYDNELYEFFVVALNTGLRLGELCGLCFDRVDFQKNTLTITRSRNRHGLKDRTKTKLKRIVPMNSLVRATLWHIFQNRKSDEPLVFLKRNGKPIDYQHVYRDFHKAQRKAGFKKLIRTHDTRHVFASLFTENVGRLEATQKLLGHTDIRMTMRYAHLSQNLLQITMQSFSLGQAKQYEDNKAGDVIFLKKQSNEQELPPNSPQAVNESF